MLLDVRVKETGEQTVIDTELVVWRDKKYVWLSYQPLGRFKGESYTLPDGKIMPGDGKPRDGKMAETTAQEEVSPELAEARAKYLEKEKKEVPNNKKNDLEWINSKLA